MLIDRPGAVQSTIDLGLPVADPSQSDWIALAGDRTRCFGGSFASRITSNIREQKGYTYSPFSTVRCEGPRRGMARGRRCHDECHGRITKGNLRRDRSPAKRNPDAPSEVRSIQNYLAGTFVLGSSSPAGLARQFGFVDLNGLGDDYLTTYVRRVYAITPAEVQRIAQQYLDPGRARWPSSAAGDKKTVADQVAPYGKVVQ